jgi:DNA modification methylase
LYEKSNKILGGKPVIIQKDSLEFLRTFNDFEFHILYADPPYQLGSEIIIRNDGKVDYKKSIDFMSKWDGLSGEYWEHWFKEAYRTLKHGGYLLMFGMDRQLLLFKYYAALAGFQEQQSLYWYYISNFPKATDLSKMIDKNAGAERQVVGKKNGTMPNIRGDGSKMMVSSSGLIAEREQNIITKSTTKLGEKYEGYKYSISPLKQTCETIMVFKKPNKTGSVLHDTLAMENGDNTITCSALNIDGNRVGTDKINIHDAPVGTFAGGEPNRGSDTESYREVEGRYPAQTFIDSQVAEKLDRQSGIIKSSNNRINKIGTPTDSPTSFGVANKEHEYNDIGGCSKILHKCDYEQIDFDLFIYNPKVSVKERNKGLDNFNNSAITDRKGNGLGRVCNICGAKQLSPCDCENNSWVLPENMKNNHPTLKPIALNEKILRLFKTPNNQKICYPFAGAGSEIIGGIKAGFDNWTACELNQDYVNIANARIAYWTKQKNMVNDIKSTSNVNEVVEKGQMNLFDLMGDN